MSIEHMPKDGGSTTPDRICPECGKTIKPRGFTSHMRGHARKAKKQSTVSTPKPKDQATPVADVIKGKTKPISPEGKRDNGRTGTYNQRTIERMAMKRQLVQRIVQNTDRIFNAQLDKAIGEKYLMVKITERGPQGGVKREYHEIVTNPETIIAFLDGELDGGTAIHDKDHFYYISTKPADNLAIQGLLDRAYGRATEKVELGGSGDSDLSELSDDDLDKRITDYLERRRRAAKTT